MLYKFGSNLNLKLNGKSVNSMNSTRRPSYMAGDLRFASRRGRGRLWRRAGTVKATAQLLSASEPCYLNQGAVVVVFLLPLFFPSPPLQLRRALAVDLAPLPSRQSLSQLRLNLTRPTDPPIQFISTGNSLSTSFFFAAGNSSAERDSSWPELHGASSSLVLADSVLSRYCGAYSIVGCSF